MSKKCPAALGGAGYQMSESSSSPVAPQSVAGDETMPCEIGQLDRATLATPNHSAYSWTRDSGVDRECVARHGIHGQPSPSGFSDSRTHGAPDAPKGVG